MTKIKFKKKLLNLNLKFIDYFLCRNEIVLFQLKVTGRVCFNFEEITGARWSMQKKKIRSESDSEQFEAHIIGSSGLITSPDSKGFLGSIVRVAIVYKVALADKRTPGSK